MERNISSLGIVLHSQRYGQQNRRLKLLTVDFGLIDVVSYGAQKSVKSVKAEVFTDAQFFLYYNPVKKDYTLKDVHVVSTHEELRQDLHKTYAAIFFCELIIKMHGGESSEEYRLLSQALDFLTGSDAETDRVIIQFVHHFSDLVGLRTDFSRCPICERTYEQNEVVSFSSTLLAHCCSNCASLDANLLLPPGARKYLMVTSPMSFEQSLEVPLSSAATLRIKRYELQYAQMISGRMLKTLASPLLWDEASV